MDSGWTQSDPVQDGVKVAVKLFQVRTILQNFKIT